MNADTVFARACVGAILETFGRAVITDTLVLEAVLPGLTVAVCGALLVAEGRVSCRRVAVKIRGALVDSGGVARDTVARPITDVFTVRVGVRGDVVLRGGPLPIALTERRASFGDALALRTLLVSRAGIIIVARVCRTLGKAVTGHARGAGVG